MSLASLFGRKSGSAQAAKERLMITLSHERAANGFPFLDQMREEIIAVVRKYVRVRDVKIHTEKNRQMDKLEIDVMLEE
jgi:cell division topological specificity factor